VKPYRNDSCERSFVPFSILERIDVGETYVVKFSVCVSVALSVSSNGSTWVKRFASYGLAGVQVAFSILERIDVGETI